jgi:hypothetical protein
LQLQHTRIPVAVTAFDIQTLKVYTIQRGSMARAARASATFPFLFQPVGRIDKEKNQQQQQQDLIFIDGGIIDHHGIIGLNETLKRSKNSHPSLPPRVINLSIGRFLSTLPPGPSQLINHPEMISISIQNLPQPAPWAMSNGPLAISAARRAMIASKKRIIMNYTLMHPNFCKKKRRKAANHYRSTTISNPVFHSIDFVSDRKASGAF